MSDELYLEHFGLREPPFSQAPDPDFLYLSTKHSLAQAYLNYALLNRDSFVVITGETGAGKTTLINNLLAEIGDHMLAAHIFQTQVSPVQFLQSLLLEFGFKPFEKKKVELLDMVNRFLIEQHERKHQVVIIVDDAHNLSAKVLEEIRLISEVDAVKGGVLNVILCGQPGLLDTLDAPGLEQFAQRVRFRFHIDALSEFETREYIEHRMRHAGAEDPEIFSVSSLPAIYRYTGGIPRLINVICDTALTGAFAEDVGVIDEKVIEGAVSELDWKPRERPPPLSAPEPEPVQQKEAPELVPAVLPAELPPQRDVERGKLLLKIDGEQVGEFPIRGERLLIGRDPDNEVHIPARFVSRHHAQVCWSGGACWITDLNSTNGTFINGRRVKKRALRDGDQIQLGRHRLLYVRPADAPDAAQPPTSIEDWRDTTIVPIGRERASKN